MYGSEGSHSGTLMYGSEGSHSGTLMYGSEGSHSGTLMYCSDASHSGHTHIQLRACVLGGESAVTSCAHLHVK